MIIILGDVRRLINNLILKVGFLSWSKESCCSYPKSILLSAFKEPRMEKQPYSKKYDIPFSFSKGLNLLLPHVFDFAFT